MKNPSITWRDIYAFCNIEPGSDADKRLFLYQPVPDYFRWLETGELHSLSQEKLKNLPVRSWTKIPSLFMPTDILDLVLDCAVLEKSLDRSILIAASFLVQLPENHVQDYLKNVKQGVEEELRNDILRDQLIQTELFRHSKLDLSNICKSNQLNTTGTKLQLALCLAPVHGIPLNVDKDLYFGGIESLPSRTPELRKLGKSKKKQAEFFLKTFSV